MTLNVATSVKICRHRPIGELVCSNSRLSIPENQRPWSWKPENLKRLWADIVQTMKRFYVFNPAEDEWKPSATYAQPHFLGVFVFVEDSKDTSLSVFDGQQRLTSLSMLMSALRMSLNEIEPNHALNKYIKDFLICGPYDGEVSRLEMDDDVAQIWKTVVTKPSSVKAQETEIKKVYGSAENLTGLNKRIYESFNETLTLVKDSMNEVTNTTPGRLSWVVAIYQSIMRGLLGIEIVLSDESACYQIFDSLNATGRPLGTTDKIKNSLFQHSASENDKTKIRQHWKALLSNAAEVKIQPDQFIRFHQTAFYSFSRKKELFETVSAFIAAEAGKGKNSSSILKTWADSAQQYGAIQNSEELQVFETLKVTYHIPVLLLAKSIFTNDSKAFKAVTALMESYMFRALTICDTRTNEIEKVIADGCEILRKTKDVEKLRQHLLKKTIDEEFKKKFASFATNKVKLQFYILRRLEDYLSKGEGLKVHEHSPTQHVEHIMPKKFSTTSKRQGEWKTLRSATDERRTKYLNRIGNLLILEKTINSDVSNYDYSAKRGAEQYPKSARKIGGKSDRKGEPRKTYKNSILTLPIYLTKKQKFQIPTGTNNEKIECKAFNTWSFEAIEERQKVLAQLAVHVWQL